MLLSLPVSLSVWKNSRKDMPSAVAPIDAGSNSPRYLASERPDPRQKRSRTGSSNSGATPASSQQASKSFGTALSVTKLPSMYTV